MGTNSTEISKDSSTNHPWKVFTSPTAVTLPSAAVLVEFFVWSVNWNIFRKKISNKIEPKLNFLQKKGNIDTDNSCSYLWRSGCCRFMDSIAPKYEACFVPMQLFPASCLYAFISFTFQGLIRYRSFWSGRTQEALVKTIKYSKFWIILVIPVYVTLPYFLSYLTIPYLLPHLTSPYV